MLGRPGRDCRIRAQFIGPHGAADPLHLVIPFTPLRGLLTQLWLAIGDPAAASAGSETLLHVSDWLERATKLHAMGRLGVAAAALGLLGASAAFATLAPVFESPDEPAHVDYAYQVWNGQLPVFQDGLLLRPNGIGPPVQWTAQHPPLFYVLMAPVIGPLANSGHWFAAVMSARLVCVAIAAACILALAWAAAALSTTRPWSWAIAAGAVAAPVAPFVRVGGFVYSDNLAMLFSVLALGLVLRMLRRGLSPGLLTVLAAVCAAGALTRATFLVSLITATAGVVLAGYLHTHGNRVRRLSIAAAAAIVPAAAAVLASGWFYQRNIELTGSWTGGHPEWAQENLGRSTRPLLDVATSGEFWRQQLQLLRHPIDDGSDYGPILLSAVFLVAAVGTLWRASRGGRPTTIQLGIAGVLLAQVAGTLMLTIAYQANGGGTVTRYLLPALLSIACALAGGILMAPGRFAGLALLVYGVLAWSLFLRWVLAQPTDGGSTVNGIPLVFVWVAVVLLLAAVVVQSWALGRVAQLEVAARPTIEPSGEPPVVLAADVGGRLR